MLCTLFIASCKNSANIHPAIEWTPEQLTKNIALQPIPTTADESKFYIRLQGSEPPHFHDKHDLMVEVLSGTAVIHYRDTTQNVKAGDKILINKGTYHWAENTGAEASIVIGTFTPKMDGKDFRLAEDNH